MTKSEMRRAALIETLKKDGMFLKDIPSPTRDQCLAAVKRYGRNLEFVPEQDAEICKAAIKNDGASDKKEMFKDLVKILFPVK